MNAALWRKAIAEAWQQLLVSAVLLWLFGWLFVWLMSQFRTGVATKLLHLLPDFVGRLAGVPLAELATPLGRLSVLYVHAVTLVVLVGWALGRGSAVVSGEIGRGTMDLLVSLPIRRVAVILVSAVVTTLGTALLVVALWLGQGVGLATVALEEPVSLWRFIPGALNLAAMIFCLTALTTLFSSWDRDRWHTILWVGGVFTLSAILKMVARLWPSGAWLRYFSFLTAYEPQRLILAGPEHAARLAWQYDATLVALGLAAYLAAAAIFSWRDIPQAH